MEIRNLSKHNQNDLEHYNKHISESQIYRKQCRSEGIGPVAKKSFGCCRG